MIDSDTWSEDMAGTEPLGRDSGPRGLTGSEVEDDLPEDSVTPPPTRGDEEPRSGEETPRAPGPTPGASQAGPGGAGAGRQRSYQRHNKPPHSYITLIAMAIRDSSSGRVTLAQINDYLRARWAFFRGPYTGWRNSVRHNLSLNECFVKVLRDPARPWGKDNYWTINPHSEYAFMDGSFRRRRRRATRRSSSSSPGKDGRAGVRALLAMQEERGGERKDNVRFSSSFTIDNLLRGTPPGHELGGVPGDDAGMVSLRSAVGAVAVSGRASVPFRPLGLALPPHTGPYPCLLSPAALCHHYKHYPPWSASPALLASSPAAGFWCRAPRVAAHPFPACLCLPTSSGKLPDGTTRCRDKNCSCAMESQPVLK